MASSTRQIRINRRTVRRCVKDNGITGVNLEMCAINIVAALGLHPAYKRKTYEQLSKLVDKYEVVLVGGVLRLATKEEQGSKLAAKAAMQTRTKRTRKRTAAKRSGGHRSLQLRTTLPLSTELT